MIPKSLSASSILVSEACMERWKVENFYKTPQSSSEPANIGTTCHFALEHFVRAVYLDKTIPWTDIKYLNHMYQIGYTQTFGSTDYNTEAFADGAQLVADWYERNKEGLTDTVLTCEVKENFPVKTSVGEIPFNFIWDRADQISETEYHVVDYKTLRAYVRPEDLKTKIQPRAYALAAQIKWPDAKRIWVSFDMMRHGGIVGTAFTREENIDTYRYIQRAAERIISTDEDATVETLNPECKWCIKKVSCETLAQANAAGTIHGMSAADAARRKMLIDNQMDALKYAQEELDNALLKEAERRDQFEWTEDDIKIELTAQKRRNVSNAQAISKIIGPELMEKYGNMTVTSIDKMLKDGVLTEEQAKEVKTYVATNWSSPRAKVKPVNPFEDGI